MPTNPEVIVVGALATKVSNIAPLRYTAEAISGGETPVHYIDGGIINREGRLSVATPSQQEVQISTIIEHSPRQDFLILSQSMGALAALGSVETFKHSKHVAALSIAPPLLFPSDTLRHPQITTISKIEDGNLILPSRSFALGDSGPTKYHASTADLPQPLQLIAPPELFEEIDTVNGAYLGRTLSALHQNRLHIIMPTEDWNKAALETAQDLPNVTYLEGRHSLISEAPLLKHNVRAMTRIARTLLHATSVS